MTRYAGPCSLHSDLDWDQRSPTSISGLQLFSSISFATYLQDDVGNGFYTSLGIIFEKKCTGFSAVPFLWMRPTSLQPSKAKIIFNLSNSFCFPQILFCWEHEKLQRNLLLHHASDSDQGSCRRPIDWLLLKDSFFLPWTTDIREIQDMVPHTFTMKTMV